MTINPGDITLSFVSENRITGKVTRRVDVDAATLLVVKVVRTARALDTIKYSDNIKQKPTNGKGPRGRWGESK